MANLLAQINPLEAASYVQQQGDAGRARGQQNMLTQLASQAYTAAPEQQSSILGQMAAIDPKAAQAQQAQFESVEDRRNKTLANMAGLLVKAPEQARAGIYQRMLPDLQRFGVEAPAAYDSTTAPLIDQTANALYQAYGAGAQGQVQSTYVDAQGNRVAILRNGSTQILGQDAPKVQIIDTGDGFYGVNKGNLSAAPVSTGGAPAAQGIAAASAAGSPAGSGHAQAFTSLASEFPGVQMTSGTRTSQRNAEVGGQPNSQHLTGTAADYAVPNAVKPAFIARARQLGYQPIDEGDHVHLQMPAGGGGQQLRSAPDKITPYQQAQLTLEQQKLEEARAQRQAELDRKNNPAPRELAQGEMSLRKEFQDQTKNSGVIINSYNQIKQAATSPSAQNDLALIFGYMRMLDPTSVVREGEFANAQNAAGVPDRIQNTYNRLLRGERLNPDQRQGFVKSADGIAALARQQVDQARTQYREMAGQYGYDPARIVGQQPGANAGNTTSPQAPAAARPNAAAGQQPTATSSTYSNLWN